MRVIWAGVAVTGTLVQCAVVVWFALAVRAYVGCRSESSCEGIIEGAGLLGLLVIQVVITPLTLAAMVGIWTLIVEPCGSSDEG